MEIANLRHVPEKTVNLCESCKKWKPRNTSNCLIQQNVHTQDIINETTTIIIKCKSYDGKK